MKTSKSPLKYVEYVILLTLAQGLRLISHKTLIRLARLFGNIGFIFMGRARRLGTQNLMKVLRCDEKTARPVVRRAFANAARVFLEIPFFYYDSTDIDAVPIHGAEHLHASLARGKGAVCVTGHIGNWDVLGRIITRNGIEPWGIARRLHNLYIDEWVSKVRASHGCNVIYQGRMVAWNRQILSKLKNGKAMFFIMDQYVSGGLKAAFCGWKVPTPTGAYRMAAAAGSPVHLVYMLMNAKGRYEVFVSPEIGLIKKDTREDEMLANTELFNRLLEDLIRAHPDQWLCFHKRFRRCEPVATENGQNEK